MLMFSVRLQYRIGLHQIIGLCFNAHVIWMIKSRKVKGTVRVLMQGWPTATHGRTIVYDQPERHSCACIYQNEGDIACTTILLFTNNKLR